MCPANKNHVLEVVYLLTHKEVYHIRKWQYTEKVQETLHEQKATNQDLHYNSIFI